MLEKWKLSAHQMAIFEFSVRPLNLRRNEFSSRFLISGKKEIDRRDFFSHEMLLEYRTEYNTLI